MDSSNISNGEELKAALEANKAICRCCLSTDRLMKDLRPFALIYRDLAGFEVVESDGMPLWLCGECSYFLVRCIRFKYRLIRSHNVLYEYLSRCTPFPIDAQDPELSKYASPCLNATDVLIFDSTGKSKLGFDETLEHVKCPPNTDEELGLSFQMDFKCESDNSIVKEENDCSDYEDNVPLVEYSTEKSMDDKNKLQIDKLVDIEREFKQLLEERGHGEGKRKIKRGVKLKKNRRNGTKRSDTLTKTSVRKPIEIDPTKIAKITLNMEEQLKLREEMSKDEGYLKFPFKCELCYKGFNHDSKLENHFKKHSPSRGKFECTLCSMYLPTIYSYNVHELTHSTRYECLVCGRRMVDRGSIVDHYRVVHEGLVKQYKCQLCPKVSLNHKTHLSHMRNHHSGSDRPECHQCGKTFINKDSLIDHLLIHQGVKNHCCDVCGKRFRTKTQVTHHQLKHTDMRNYYCVECDVRFKSDHNLRQHLHKSIKHRDKTSLKYPCSRCDLRFDSVRSLQHHITFQHDGLRLYSCEHCGASLATRNSLVKHVRSTHQGHKPPLKHVCDTCGKAFRSKNTLTNHVRTHTGEKPFECQECGRYFSQRTAMRTHVKLVHLKIKRNAKVKDIQELTGNKVVTKQELPVVFQNWHRQSMQNEVYFTVTAGP